MNRVLAALVLALALAGCGSADGGKHGAEPPATPASAVPTGSRTLQLREVIALDDADADQQADLKAFSCPTSAETAADQSTSDIACDSSGQKYLLRPAAWEGRAVSATATLPDYGGGWVVDVQLGTTGARAFSRLTRKLYASGAQLAFLVGGRVITAAVVNGVITTGQLEVAGLDKTSATALAHQLA